MMQHAKITVLAVLLAPAAALSQINAGDELGVSETAIRTALEAQGYSASEIEFEDGEIEVEALRNGQSFEIAVSPDTGLVVAVYDDDDQDDADDDSDDDEDDDDDRDDDDHDDADDSDDDDD